MLALAAAVMVPAVVVKFIVEAPAGTITDAATGSRVLLLDSVTVAPPLNAAPDSVTAQEVDCPDPRTPGVHTRLVRTVAGTS